jgi:hypothetical protein
MDRGRDQARADALMLALRVVTGGCVLSPWIDETATLRDCPHAFTAWRRLERHVLTRGRVSMAKVN